MKVVKQISGLTKQITAGATSSSVATTSVPSAVNALVVNNTVAYGAYIRLEYKNATNTATVADIYIPPSVVDKVIPIEKGLDSIAAIRASSTDAPLIIGMGMLVDIAD